MALHGCPIDLHRASGEGQPPNTSRRRTRMLNLEVICDGVCQFILACAREAKEPGPAGRPMVCQNVLAWNLHVEIWMPALLPWSLARAWKVPRTVVPRHWRYRARSGDLAALCVRSPCGGSPCKTVSEPWRRSPSDWAARRRPHRLKSARPAAQLCRSAAKSHLSFELATEATRRPRDAALFRRRTVRPRCAAK